MTKGEKTRKLNKGRKNKTGKKYFGSKDYYNMLILHILLRKRKQLKLLRMFNV